MYYKKEAMLVVLVLLLALTSFFFSGQGITGSAIAEETSDDLIVGIVPGENFSIDPGTTENNEIESINDGNIEVQAACGGGVACNCGDTVTSNYNFSASLTDCPAFGLLVGASNIMIDCKGFSLTGATSGFENSGFDGVTIQNCVIQKFQQAIRVLDGAQNGTIINNTIITNGTGLPGGASSIEIDLSNGNNITNNIFNRSNKTSGAGVYLTESNNTFIKNNQFIGEIVVSSGSWSGSYYTIIRNNTFVNSSVTISQRGDVINNTFSGLTRANGFVIGANTNYSRIINNTIENSSLHQNNAITITGSHCVINNNRITNSSSDFFILYSLISLDGSINCSVTNNTLHKTEGNLSGILVTGGSKSNIFADNKITNSSYGYFFDADAGELTSNNLFLRDIIANNTQGVIINLQQSSGTVDNNTFVNSILSGNSFDVNLSATTFAPTGDSIDLTLLNVSFNRSKVFADSTKRIYVQWYVFANVTDTAKNQLYNVEVTGKNSIGVVDNVETTDSNGIARLILMEYYRDGEVDYITTPHNIKAILNNYTTNSTSISIRNVTSDQTLFVNLTLSQVACGSILTSTAYIGRNMTCNGTALVAGVSHITLFGNGFFLNGNSSGSGILIPDGIINISISDLTIRNFTYGIYLNNSDYNNITHVTAINNTHGIFFNNSDSNNIYDSNVSYNLLYDSVAASSSATENKFFNSTFNISNTSVTAMATLFKGWYVVVNSTFNGGLVLANANSTAVFNSTGLQDDSHLTNNDGLVRLALSELKKNATDIYYLTPHNVSISYSSSTQTVTNQTGLNLSVTQNTKINLSLTLDCTAPKSNSVLNSNLTFCPGTFAVYNITLKNSTMKITCDRTTLSSPDNLFKGITVKNNSVTIKNCIFANYDQAIIIERANRVNLTGINASGCNSLGGGCINLIYSNYSLIKDFKLSSCKSCLGIYSSSWNNISSGTIGSTVGNSVLIEFSYGSQSNIISNISFTSGTRGIEIAFTDTIINNKIYNNSFSGLTTNLMSYTTNYFNKTFLEGATTYTRGNNYDDYCEKGKDLNSDGYADNVTSLAAADWPYNSTVSSKVLGSAVDYGPRIHDCVTEVQLGGGSSSGGGGSSSSAAGAAAAPAPAAPSAGSKTVQPKVEEDAYDAENAKKYLQSESTTQRISPTNFQVKFTLENTGTKRMELFPEILQQVDDPYFIITRKTLGFEGSLFSDISCISYSNDAITGRLLKAELVNPEKIILEPGEKIDKIIEVNEGLSIPRQIKIQFTTFGETVIEQDIQEAAQTKAVSGTAVDVDTDQDILDLYAVIFPQQLAERFNTGTTSPITGAAIAEPPTSNKYLLEFTVNRKTPQVLPQFKASKLALSEGLLSLLSDRISTFTDLYGPYEIREDQALVFAQQLKYEEGCFDDYEMKARIYREGETVVENSFEVSLN